MTTAEVKELAERNGVRIRTTVLGFGQGVEVEATHGAYRGAAVRLDPDRAMVDAIEVLVWRVSDEYRTSALLSSPVGWAFAVFDQNGSFPVTEAA